MDYQGSEIYLNKCEIIHSMDLKERSKKLHQLPDISDLSHEKEPRARTIDQSEHKNTIQ